MGQLEEALPRRAAELGAPSSASPATTLRDQVATELAEIAEAHQLPLDALCTTGLGGSARTALREEVLTRIELAAHALRDRLAAGQSLSTLDEAREWLALAALYEEGVTMGGASIRQLTFRTVYHPLSTLSVELHTNAEKSGSRTRLHDGWSIRPSWRMTSPRSRSRLVI